MNENVTSSSSEYEEEEGEAEQEEPSVSGFQHFTHGNVELNGQEEEQEPGRIRFSNLGEDEPPHLIQSYRREEVVEESAQTRPKHQQPYANQACVQQSEILGIQEEDSGTIDDGVGSDQDEGGQKCIKNAVFAAQGATASDIFQLRRKRSKGKSQQLKKLSGYKIAGLAAPTANAASKLGKPVGQGRSLHLVLAKQ